MDARGLAACRGRCTLDPPAALRQRLDLSRTGRSPHRRHRHDPNGWHKLAVPPAYQDVLYAEDPAAHLQATGRDAQGRLQYRYHPDWEKVREIRKARRLARLADALPRIHRSLGRHLASMEPNRQFTFAAVIELVARSAIRPGSESYARLRGTRGAATLLKSNVTIYGETITLAFRGKGGKKICKELTARAARPRDRIAAAIAGTPPFSVPRGERRPAPCRCTQEVNAFLREIAGMRISLEGFSDPAGVGERIRDAGAGASRPPAKASVASRCWRRSAPPPKRWPIRPPSAAKATFINRWWQPSRKACSSNSPTPSSAAARPPGGPSC